MALRMLHEFLAEGGRRSHQVALAPHLVMRGNLEFFLRRQSQESSKEKSRPMRESVQEFAEDYA
jgi:hypothetical protein